MLGLDEDTSTCQLSPEINLAPPANLSLRVGSAATLRCLSTGPVTWSVADTRVWPGPPQTISPVQVMLATDQTLQIVAMQPVQGVHIECMTMSGSEGLLVSDSSVTMLSIQGKLQYCSVATQTNLIAS